MKFKGPKIQRNNFFSPFWKISKNRKVGARMAFAFMEIRWTSPTYEIEFKGPKGLEKNFTFPIPKSTAHTWKIPNNWEVCSYRNDLCISENPVGVSQRRNQVQRSKGSGEFFFQLVFLKFQKLQKIEKQEHGDGLRIHGGFVDNINMVSSLSLFLFSFSVFFFSVRL